MSNQPTPRLPDGYISPLRHAKDQTWAEMLADIELERQINCAKYSAKQNKKNKG